MTSFAPPQGDPPTIAMIQPARLKVDPNYQRSLDSKSSRRLIGSIAAEWDWRLCVPLIVSDRGADGLFVIDGQHRKEAASMRGDIGYLPCSVSRFASVADEAMLFISANRRRRAVSRVDDFRAAVAAGDAEAVVIHRLVEDAGLKISQHTNTKAVGPGELVFTTGLKSALKTHGADIVAAALRNIGDAFPDELLVNAGALFAALVEIHAHPPEQFDADRLFSALLAHDTGGWSSRARLDLISGGGQRAGAIRAAVMSEYRTNIGRAAA